jgi:hypothetical protein
VNPAGVSTARHRQFRVLVTIDNNRNDRVFSLLALLDSIRDANEVGRDGMASKEASCRCVGSYSRVQCAPNLAVVYNSSSHRCAQHSMEDPELCCYFLAVTEALYARKPSWSRKQNRIQTQRCCKPTRFSGDKTTGTGRCQRRPSLSRSIICSPGHRENRCSRQAERDQPTRLAVPWCTFVYAVVSTLDL